MTLVQLLHTAVAHHRSGQIDEAARLYRQILDTQPQHADAWQLLGAIHYQQGRFDEAIAHIQRALDLGVRHAGMLNNLGAAYRAVGRDADAVAALRESLTLEPRSASAWNNLANALKQLDQLDESQTAYLRALELEPNFADAHDNLARLFQQRHESRRAIHHYQHALRLKPLNPRSHNNLGALLLGVGLRAEALVEFDIAIEQQPNYARAWNNRGSALRELGRPVDAAAAFRRALECDPTLFEAANNEGEVCAAQGRVDEGLRLLERAVAQAPHDAPIHSNLVMMHQYRPGVTLAELRQITHTWAERHAPASLAAHVDWPQSRAPDRRLRVGFISADLGRHPVGCIVLPLIEQLDRSQFEPWLYATRQLADPVQYQLRVKATTWRDVAPLTVEQLVAQIRTDQIDVLFDLSGHTAHNRLGVFARRAAPVQVTWAGYQSTTGISAIDYLLSDPQMVVAGTEHEFCERIAYLPEAAWCCRIESPPIDVGPPPCLTRGQVTFGSFNNASKVSPVVVELWGRVLRAVPGSRLILKYRGFDDPGLTAYFHTLFQAQGVAAERIECRGQTTFDQMLAEYREVDIALDPLPFGGGMTSLLALWMGVPVVTWPQETIASRQTYSMLSLAGDTSTVARSADEYVQLAQALAGDPARLVELRRRLRDQISATAFLDPARFVPTWERAVRELWIADCGLRIE